MELDAGEAGVAQRLAPPVRADVRCDGAVSWRDRNLKFYEYKRKRPTKNVQAILDHIETRGDPIFWG